mgnify:FL=1
MREKINRLYEKSIDKLREKQALFLEIEQNPKKIFTDLYEDYRDFAITVFGYSRKIIGETLSKHKMQEYITTLVERYIATVDDTIITTLIDKNYFPGEIGLFYKGYSIARFSIYDKKFINVWDDFNNPYEKSLNQMEKELEKLKQERDEYEKYIKNPKSILKKYADSHIIQKTYNYFYLKKNTEKFINHYKGKVKNISGHIKRYEERISSTREKSADFDLIVGELEKKYQFWKDKFINEFGYTFEDRGFGGMTHTMDVLRKLNKNI